MDKLKRMFAVVLTVIMCYAGLGVSTFAAAYNEVVLTKYTGVAIPGDVVLGMNVNSTVIISWKNKAVYFTDISTNKSREVAVGTPTGSWVNRNYCISSDNSMLAIVNAFNDGTMDVIDISSEKLVASFDVFSIKEIAFTNDNKMIVGYGDLQGMVTYFDIESESVFTTHQAPGTVSAMAVNPASSEIAISSGNIIQIRDLDSWSLLHSINQKSDRLVYSKDGKYLLASSGGVQVSVLDTKASYNLKTTLSYHIPSYKPSFTDDNKVLLQDRLYDLESSKPDRYTLLTGGIRRSSTYAECRFSVDYKYAYNEYGDIYYADKLFGASQNATSPEGAAQQPDKNGQLPPTNPNENGSAPNAALTLTAAPQTNGVQLKWTSPADTSKTYSYVVMRQLQGSSESVPTHDFPVKSLSLTDLNAESGKTYLYWCESTDGEGGKLKSNVVTVAMPATGAGTVGPSAEAKTVVVLQINNPVMTVNGVDTPIDSQGTAPVFFGQRAIVPVRAIVESLGGTVGWDEDTWEVTATLGENAIVMKIDSKLITVNGVEKEIDTAPQLVGKRTMLPIRFVAENLGLDVIWHEDTFEIEIVRQGALQSEDNPDIMISEDINNNDSNSAFPAQNDMNGSGDQSVSKTDMAQSVTGFSEYPEIPDFGKFIGVGLLSAMKSYDTDKNNNKYDVIIYQYSFNEVRNAPKTEEYFELLDDMGIKKEYITIFEGNGYHIQTHVMGDLYMFSVGQTQ